MSGSVAAVGEGVTGWSVGRSRHRHAAGLVRQLPSLPRGPYARLPQPELPRHRFAGVDAGALGCSRRGARRAASGSPAARCGAMVEPTAVAVHDVRRADLQRARRLARRRRRADRPARRVRCASGRSRRARSRVRARSGARSPSELGLRAVDPAGCDVDALVADWTDGAGVAGRLRGLGRRRRAGSSDQPDGRPRAARRRRDPRDAAAGEPVPRLLARADAHRRARL